ncbi:MAG TPA: hypothetical protein VML94_03355 [Thermoplasmata archaeon]|nr:hypothetical protein [Thermoplasmata archaeon]
MAQAPPPAAWTPPTSTAPAASSAPKGGGSSLATILAVVAIVLSLVAVGISFANMKSTSTSSAPGVAPESLYAVVASNGALVRASGVNGSIETGTGTYQVNFTQILYQCTYSAILGTTGTGVQPAGYATVAKDAANSSDLDVSTYNQSTHALTSYSFHIVASCPGGLYAAVSATGTFVSGAGVSASFSQGLGAYTVLFNQDVAGCAFSGGLGESGSGPSSSGMFTVADRAGNSNGVWIDTFLSNGTLSNESFHLEVYC